MRRKSGGWLAATAVALCLAGCGGGGGSAPPPVVVAPTPSPAPPPVPTPTPAPASVEHDVLPALTSAQININLSSHYAINPAPTVAARGRLFVMLPGTGAVPVFYRQILRVGAARGYHAIGLTYPNDAAIELLCAGSPADCTALARQEIITGADVSPLVAVNSANSINGRLAALLTYLQAQYPAEGWGQYLVAGLPDWSRISVGGHSQGAGHAAYMGKLVTLDRVAMFSGPADNFAGGAAPWLGQPGQTSAARHYGFTHSGDTIVPLALTLATWSALGLPASGPATNVDGGAAPFGNSHQLVTNVAPNLTVPNIAPEHSATVVDAITPVTAQGAFVFEPVWTYMAFP